MPSLILRFGLLLSLLVARPAAATVDMSGEWYIEFHLFGSSIHGQATVTQSGTSLTIVSQLSCGSCPQDTSVGTIDPDTGVYAVTSTTYPAGLLVHEGTVAADSYTFAGGLFVNGNPEGTVTGSRCANGVLEAPEQCDDGNRSDVDCCSSTCQFRPAGASCPQDNVQCTDAVCDGAGSCTHPSSAPGTLCEADGESCTRETCDGAGTCSTTSFIPAGFPCLSLNGEYFCTLNECDGAGTCTHTPQNEGVACSTVDQNVCTIDQCVSGVCTTIDNVTCGTCESCDPTDGCGARPQGCTPAGAYGAKLILQDDPVKGDLVQWRWPRGQSLPLGDIGASSAANGAVLCVIDTATSTALATAEYPPGADWRGTPQHATYKRTTPTGKSGVQISRLRPTEFPPRLAISTKSSGSEANVAQLSSPSSTVVVELRHGSGVCWGTQFSEGDLVRETATTRRYTTRRP